MNRKGTAVAGVPVPRNSRAAEPRPPVGVGRGHRQGAGGGVRGGGAGLRAASRAARAAGAPLLLHAAHSALAPRLLPRALLREGLPAPPQDGTREHAALLFVAIMIRHSWRCTVCKNVHSSTRNNKRKATNT